MLSVGERTQSSVGRRRLSELPEADLHPEPFKTTVLAVLPSVWFAAEDFQCLRWQIRLMIPIDEHAGVRSNITNEYVDCGGEGPFYVNFTHPGNYEIVVLDDISKQVVAERIVENKYVRRDVYSLTSSEWNDYVHAVWTLRDLSTDEGRQYYTCPSGKQTDYREYDFFVLFHGFYSANATCDQLHFSMMQEFAHEAWNTLFERALQCVVPSVSLHYWNEAVEKQTAKARCQNSTDPGGCLAEQLKSADVWNSTMYGRVTSDDDAAYVVDGAFARFPIRQNRTGLCQFIEEYNQDDMARCEEYISHPVFWAGKDENLTGFWFPSPRPSHLYEFVSRKTGHIAGLEGFLVDETFPGVEGSNGIRDIMMPDGVAIPFVEQLRHITGDEVHGHAHYWISGLWGEYAETLNATVRNAGVQAVGLLRAFVWPQDARGRADGCVVCNDNSCSGVGGQRQILCENSNEFTPDDTFDVDATQMANMDHTSWWRQWIYNSRVENVATRRAMFGYNAARGGTFDRSATANQDPTFYLHHAFTFAVVDFAKRAANEPPPFYGLDNYSYNECPGHRLDDATVFKNLVPYKTHQEPGSAHTWRDILEMWGENRSWTEWEPLL